VQINAAVLDKQLFETAHLLLQPTTATTTATIDITTNTTATNSAANNYG